MFAKHQIRLKIMRTRMKYLNELNAEFKFNAAARNCSVILSMLLKLRMPWD